MTGGMILLPHASSTARFVLQEKLTSEEIHHRLETQLGKLRQKDRASIPLSAEVGGVSFASDSSQLSHSMLDLYSDLCLSSFFCVLDVPYRA